MGDTSMPAFLRSLLDAVNASPRDVPLRLHTAEALVKHGYPADAVAQCSAVLQQDAGNADALALLAQATDALRGQPASSPPAQPAPAQPAPAQPAPAQPVPAQSPPTESALPEPSPDAAGGGFDWQAAEQDLGPVVEPAFVEDGPASVGGEVERVTMTLADVGGLQDVKERLEIAFLAPMRNPEMRRLFGKSLPGGLLLYGPPGCGKTFIARAVAGELGAHFHAVSVSDVLEMWLGNSERNLHEMFEVARRNAPCVLFFDEIDALGQKRSQLRYTGGMRGVVNQLLTEMDSVKSDNSGVFVLGATNHPWDVDTALLRPGRFDRVLLVTPPDAPARAAILRYHLRDRPLEGIEIASLVQRSEQFSGADLAHLCDTAAERAMIDSVRSGQVRPVRMQDFELAFREVKPSMGSWLQDARNVVMFANAGGRFDDLLAYLKQRGMA